jgi:hypothetical protein
MQIKVKKKKKKKKLKFMESVAPLLQSDEIDFDHFKAIFNEGEVDSNKSHADQS